MARSHSNRRPTFIWQAVLIVLPVIVLVVVAIVSIREDKLLAQREAAERAQEIADALLPRVRADLTAANNLPERTQHLLVDGSGQLLFPPPVAAFPAPRPLDITKLDPPQLELWKAAQSLEGGTYGLLSLVDVYRKFLDSNPPEDFAAVAEYGLGLALMNNRDLDGAVEAFSTEIEDYPNASGDSGLPLQPLARLKLLEMTSFGQGYRGLTNRTRHSHFVGRRPQNYVSPSVLEAIPHTNPPAFVPVASLESYCSNIVFYPSPLTPYLLDAISDHLSHPTTAEEALYLRGMQPPNIGHWQKLWQEQQAARSLYEAARPHLKARKDLFWFDSGRETWLASQFAGAPTVPTGEVVGLLRGTTELRAPPRQNYLTADFGSSHGTVDGTAGVEKNTGLQWLTCRTAAEVSRSLSKLLQSGRPIPDYFGISVEIAGRSMGVPGSDLRLWHMVNLGGKGASIKKVFSSDLPVPMLATNGPHAKLLAYAAVDGEEVLLKVNVFLTSPQELFERQTARTFWFGSLIAVSAAAAFVGLLTAWRAFYSQQRLSEMKSNFVSSVSHELRAPIASVRLLAESLEKGKIHEPEKQKEYFRFIGQECRRLSGLIQNVLDFSRMDQGRKRYEFEPTDLLALTSQTVALMQTYAEEKQVALRLNLEGLPPAARSLELLMDGRAIQQALVNLIDNAIKHSPKGETVMVGVECVSEETASSPQPSPPVEERGIKVWVEDRGPGIPVEEHKKIFERFYRVGSELRRETQGVGIGLSIVKHVVEAHGGVVRVRSAPGEGSRFTIELPGSGEGR